MKYMYQKWEINIQKNVKSMYQNMWNTCKCIKKCEIIYKTIWNTCVKNVKLDRKQITTYYTWKTKNVHQIYDVYNLLVF